MQFHSFRRVVVIASVIVASVTATEAFAQTQIDVLTGLTNEVLEFNGTVESTYTFNQPMILNSIGFLSQGQALPTISYAHGSAITNLLESQLSAVDANGLRWYNLPNGGLSVNVSSVLKVSTLGVYTPASTAARPRPAYYSTYFRGLGSTNSSSNVTYNGMNVLGTSYTNSNLRVSSPTSNVAPEPGTFALALTGGAALLGICIRRRRNAA
jgi:hypothetical protein